MFDKRAHHIPEDYASRPLTGATMWTGASDEGTSTTIIEQIAKEAFAAVPGLLEFQPRRALHLVMYASLDDSRLALDGDLSPTFLLAPLHTDDASVIAIHSPRLHPSNGDEHRMLRHLCHEMSHVCAAEHTGSTKRLGDGNTGMHLRPWVDEGLAVCVAAEAARQPDVIERVLAQGADAPTSMDEIDHELCALDSPRRSWAFGVATSRVWAGVQRRGFPFVFDHLGEPERWS